MRDLLRHSLFVGLALIIISLCSTNTSAISPDEEISSPSANGIWVNDTLEISGSTTINPQNANWVLYNVTDPYVEWDIVRSGSYFTTVTPVDEGIWIWTIVSDVSGLNCTCWLEINQPLELDKVFFNRIIFVGNGPHNPVISPLHETTFHIDQKIVLESVGVFSEGNLTQSSIIAEWCYAPNGACEGGTFTDIFDSTWDSNTISFELNVSRYSLSDGRWKFDYFLRDEFLRDSPVISNILLVDQNDPTARLSAPLIGEEGSVIVIDGSSSSDGIWANNLQSLWYVTNPMGEISVVNSSEIKDLVYRMNPQLSGNYTIRLDVFDYVGRTSSTDVTIEIINIPPDFIIYIDEIYSANRSQWRGIYGDEFSIRTVVFDSDSDLESMKYIWSVGGEVFSHDQNITITNLSVGMHTVKLELIDDDGGNANYSIIMIIDEPIEDVSSGIDFEVISVLILVAAGVFLLFTSPYFPRKKNQHLPKWNNEESQNLVSGVESEDDDWN